MWVSETHAYANTPRDRGVGLDLMGARFYAPDIGVWTQVDPLAINSPEQTVGAEFATANPYAYANLTPRVAKDPNGEFWQVVAVGAVVGGGIEAARQYLQNGKVEDWGRVGAAAAGGAVSGIVQTALPGVETIAMVGVGAASTAAGGAAERLIASGGKSAGTLTDLAIDAGVGAATGGVVRGRARCCRRRAGKAPVGSAPAGRLASSAQGTLTDVERKQLQQIADRFRTEIHVVGSRAAGRGRNIETSLPIGKNPPDATRSDIDVIIDGQVDIDSSGALTDAIRDVGNGAGSVISARGFSSPPHIKFKPGGGS